MQENKVKTRFQVRKLGPVKYLSYSEGSISLKAYIDADLNAVSLPCSSCSYCNNFY